MEPDELGFRVGEVIEILDMTDDQWWHGSVGDASGWFPSSFVRVSQITNIAAVCFKPDVPCLTV